MRTVELSAGALIRLQVRAYLDMEGVEWIEHKGFFRSIFVVRGTDAQLTNIGRTVAEHERKVAALRD